jgi:signal transduction histidine kinase/DNA-binding response OmpR family regulator
MHASQAFETQTATMLDDLVRDSLNILTIVTGGVVWVWASFVALFDPAHTIHAYLALALILTAGLVSHHLSQRRLRLAVALFLAGLIAIITLIVLAYPSAAVLYLYLQVVLITAVLTNPPVTWGVTVTVSLLMLLLGRSFALTPGDLALPIMMVLMTTTASWLSARRLFTALAWAFNLSQHAQQSAAEARDHRGELQRVLTTLDLAYSRLERAHQAQIFAQEAAEKAYRFKSDFVANVSHELRTPLNLIVGFSEMMAMAPESYGGVPLPREYRGDMMAIYRSARHLLDLINDVLDLSQIEAGRMAVLKERADLGEVIHDAVEIVRGLAEARRLQLLLELPTAPIAIDLDRIRIRQVLLNLLTNAMRYTDAGWVRVNVAVEPQTITLTVADSGRGIAPEKLPRAFEAFDRLDEEHLREGSGLGLAVSKKFVELHEGKMWIESAVGRGTRVHFTLPRPLEQQSMPLAPLRLTRPLVRRTPNPLVLVLHDDPRAVLLLRRHVSQCEFVLAETVETAQGLMQKLLPDALLIDTTWCERKTTTLASLLAATATPVLTCPLPSVHHLGLLMGATDYLPKPVTREDLAAALARLPNPPCTALVVDDDPHIVRLIGRMLKSIDGNLRVLEAFGGEEGLAIARSHQPDVLFLDLVMPEVSGYNVIQALADEPALAHIARIVVSVRSIEQESAPLVGALRLQRTTGFSLTELLNALRALLLAVTQPERADPASVATP